MKTVLGLTVFLLTLLCQPGLAATTSPKVFYQVGDWQVLGEAPHYLDVGLGLFDALEERGGRRAAAARLELRWGQKLWFIGPALGVLLNADGGCFGYGGIYADIQYKNLIVTPLLSVGGYRQGDGKDLGQVFQFRSAVAVSWQVADRWRVGLQVAHISNAGLSDRNPGAEDVLLTLGWAF